MLNSCMSVGLRFSHESLLHDSHAAQHTICQSELYLDCSVQNHSAAHSHLGLLAQPEGHADAETYPGVTADRKSLDPLPADLTCCTDVWLAGTGRRAWTFTDLLHHVHDAPGIERIRFATSHPRYFTERLIRKCAELPKLCEFFHIPFQSGDNDILREVRLRRAVVNCQSARSPMYRGNGGIARQSMSARSCLVRVSAWLKPLFDAFLLRRRWHAVTHRRGIAT